MSHRSLRIGFLILFVLCAVGASFGWALGRVPPANLYFTHHTLIFLQLRDQDAIWFQIMAAVLLAGAVLAWSARRGRWPADFGERLIEQLSSWHGGPAGRAILLLSVGIIIATGSVLTHHAFLFSMDEYLSAFQARIFQNGDLFAAVPSPWQDKLTALQLEFTYSTPDGEWWASGYRPVFAAIWAVFSLLAIDVYLNSVLSVLCLPLLALIARQIWPTENQAALVAVLLLATSTQFLITGMSGFAWPAHLFVNLLWLHLFLRDGTLSHVLAGLVGFLAIGLHQLHPHAFFVLPFLVGLVWSKRWAPTLYYAVIYLAAIAVWAAWHRWGLAVIGIDAVAAPKDVLRVTGIIYIDNYLAAATSGKLAFDYEHRWSLMAGNLLRFISWENALLLPLFYVALRRLGRAPTVIKQLLAGIVLSLILYLVVMPNALNSWGYRYLHNLLGSFALIAAFGWLVAWGEATASNNRNRLATAFVFFAGFSLLIALPLRIVQVDKVVKPIASAADYLARLPVEVVMLDHYQIWHSHNLFRNDPYLSRSPIIVSLGRLTSRQIIEICSQNSTQVVGYEDLSHLGVIRWPRDFEAAIPELPRLRETASKHCS